MTDPTQALRLLIATRNSGKLREFETLLDSLPLHLYSLDDFTEVAEAAEPHHSFRNNARAKARFYADQTGFVSLSDDSGLEVDALGSAPGVHSARYGGTHLTTEERTRLLLVELDKTGDAHRRARFVCAIAITRPNTDTIYDAIGCCEGHIARSMHGTHGFGYDPVFVPDGYTQTFAEMDSTTKDRISHRAQAMEKARALLKAMLTTNTHS